MSLENFGDEDIEIDDAASNKSVLESIKKRLSGSCEFNFIGSLS